MTTPLTAAFRSAMMIVNPTSGQGDSGTDQFAQYLKDAQVRDTTPDGTAEDYVQDLADFDALIGAGGDGTVSSLAYAARAFRKPYLPYPAGTANLIAQNLDLPTEPRALADLFLSGQTLTLDLAELDIEGKTRGFAMLAGLGVDAAMIRDSEETKGRFGVGAYLISALKQLSPEQAHFTLTLDGRGVEVDGMGVMVANFGLANFRVPITGEVSPADGKLTVIVLRGGTLASLLPTLIGSLRARLNLGDPNLGDSLERYEAAEVTVHSSVPLPAQCDGETLEGTLQHFRARVLPGSVRYITSTTLADLTT